MTEISATYTISPNEDEITVANLNGITNLNIEGVESNVVLDTVDNSFDAVLTITYNTVGEDSVVKVYNFRSDAVSPKWYGVSSSSDFLDYSDIDLIKIVDNNSYISNKNLSANNEYVWFILEYSGIPKVMDQNGFSYDVGSWNNVYDNAFVYKNETLTLFDGIATVDFMFIRSSIPMTFSNINLSII